MTCPEYGGPAPVTKQAFLERLRVGMASLPQERIREVEEDIHRHFDEGMEGGVEEGKLAEMLGSPEALAREYIALYEGEGGPPAEPVPPESARPRGKKGRGLMGKIWAGIGMFFVNLCFGIPFWALVGVVWLVLAMGYVLVVCGALVVILSAVRLVIPIWWLNSGYPWVTFFGALFCISLGCLMILGLSGYNKFVKASAGRYVAINRRAVLGGNQS